MTGSVTPMDPIGRQHQCCSELPACSGTTLHDSACQDPSHQQTSHQGYLWRYKLNNMLIQIKNTLFLVLPLQTHTVSDDPNSDLEFMCSSGFSGFHFSQRSGSEVTLPLHNAASVSDSSSHHTSGSSSTGWGGNYKKTDQIWKLRWTEIKILVPSAACIFQ